MKKIKDLALSGFQKVRGVVNSKEFKLAYKRGLLVSITLVVVFTIKKQLVNAAVEPDFLYTKEPLGIHPTHNWRERLFAKKYGLSNAGLATGIMTVGISGYFIYRLYNDTLVLQGQNLFLKKAQNTLQFTIYKGSLALARSNKAIDILEKTLESTVQAMDMIR